MRVLGMETSGDTCGVAVVEEGKLLGELQFRHRMDLSRRLLAGMDRLLDQLELRVADLEGIAVSVGPGSFTGLRVGVTTAKTLAWALGVPVAGISTLAALAASWPGRDGELLCPLLAGGGEQVYAGLFRRQGETLVVVDPVALFTAVELAHSLAAREEEIVFGAAAAHREGLRRAMGERAVFLQGAAPAPRAGIVAQLGAARLAAGEGDDPVALAPAYLQPPAAEARRRACAAAS